MKKNLRKVMAMALSTVMIMGVTACGSADEGAKTDSDSEAKTRIGIVQMADNGAFSDMREGFIEQMNAQGFTEENTEFIYKNAQSDASNLNTICQQMVSDGMDLVATIATPATQAMVNQKSDIPVVFIAVSSPVEAGVVEAMDKTVFNATGTSNPIPAKEMVDLALEVTPDMKKMGILYTSGEINAVNTAKHAMEYLDEKGIEYVETVITNSSEVQQAAQQLSSECDAIFIPNDSVIQSAMPVVAAVTKEAGIPVYGSSAVMVEEGAFATIAVSDKEIGAKSADMAVDVLGGKAVSEMPVIEVPGTETIINRTTMDAIGVSLASEEGIQFMEN